MTLVVPQTPGGREQATVQAPHVPHRLVPTTVQLQGKLR